MRSLVPVVLVVFALGAAGCGGGGSSGGGSSPGAVSMKGLRFHPDNVTVKVGEKVTWTNDDNVDHNVTATGGAKFMSQAFGHGKTYSFTPRRAGVIKYVCTLHPGMLGKLVVKG